MLALNCPYDGRIPADFRQAQFRPIPAELTPTWPASSKTWPTLPEPIRRAMLALIGDT
jgi:hypothetical protein